MSQIVSALESTSFMRLKLKQTMNKSQINLVKNYTYIKKYLLNYNLIIKKKKMLISRLCLVFINILVLVI